MSKSVARTPPWASVCVLLLGVHPLASPAFGQEPARRPEGRNESVGYRASAYLPLGHWAYPAIEYWISVGRIGSLSPFVRPYRRIDVARALRKVEEERLYAFEKDLMRRLRAEFEPELSALRGTAEGAGTLDIRFAAGGTYRSQQHRDALRPELEGRFSDDDAFEHMSVRAVGQAGVLAGGFIGTRDKIFVNDAQFPDGRVVPRTSFPIFDEGSFRIQEGYAELQTKFARLFFGRMYRNWGPPGLLGFLRSNYAYSEEEIGYRFGVDEIFLIGFFTSYGDFRSDTTHYHAVHRLEVRPVHNLMLAVSEATVHGGPSQSVNFRLINPVSIWQFARADDDPPHNKLGQLDLWWRPVRGLALYGSFLADATNEEQSCCQIGGSFGFALPTVAPGWLVRANVTAIQSLAYRTSLPWEEYSVERIGLGWDKTDLYLATLEAEWFAGPGLLLRPRLDVQVKGEGDFRELRPPAAALDTFPRILVGDAETTFRPSLAGRWRSGTSFPIDVEWDLGVNIITDYRNETGDDRTEFVGSVRAVIETPRIGIVLP
ncbi:MAG: capsule assembly Wzi family protein [Gemmatimonadota bacterium]